MGHKTFAEFEKEIDSLNARSYIGKKCFHYKDPDKHYTILDIVVIEATEKIGFVYSSSRHPNIKWVRPIEELFDEKEVEGKIVKRFNFIE